MSNMSYCRFQNTLRDFWDCADALDELEGDLSTLSNAEAEAARELLSVCAHLVDRYGDGSDD